MLASAPSLAERMRPRARRLLFAPNVADATLFATALDDGPHDAAIGRSARPRIVFTGAIAAKKLDLGAARRGSRGHVRTGRSSLVGPVGLGDTSTDVSALAALPNVHLAGPRRLRPTCRRCCAEPTWP